MKALALIADMKAEAQKVVMGYTLLEEAVAADLKESKDAGFDEGVAQNSTAGDKIYTEEDLQAELAEVVAASKAQVEARDARIAELEAAAEAVKETPKPAPSEGGEVVEDGGIVLGEGQVIVEQADLDKLNEQVIAVVKERDALRAAITAEIEDAKKDTSRLEQAIAPVQEAETPVIPEPVPVVTEPADDAGQEEDQAEEVKEEVPTPSEDAPVTEEPKQEEQQ